MPRATLRGGEAGPALVGAVSGASGRASPWRPLPDHCQHDAVNNPNGFSPQELRSMIAFILQQNGCPQANPRCQHCGATGQHGG